MMPTQEIIALSQLFDRNPAYDSKQSRTLDRVGKCTEEAAEALSALRGYYALNTRKGQTHTIDNVLTELLDVAAAALCAYVHMIECYASSPHPEYVLSDLNAHVHRMAIRSGVVSDDHDD